MKCPNCRSEMVDLGAANPFKAGQFGCGCGYRMYEDGTVHPNSVAPSASGEGSEVRAAEEPIAPTETPKPRRSRRKVD